MRSLRFWVLYSLTGALAAILFISTQRLLSGDNLFDLSDLMVTLMIPLILVAFIHRVTKASLAMLVAVTYLTLLMPVLGGAFGGTGSEPIWMFGLMGILGASIWSLILGVMVRIVWLIVHTVKK